MADELILNVSDNKWVSRAMSFCAASEQCTFSVKQKLEQWGCPDAEVEEVIARLKEGGYLDDFRFCRAYCESKMLGQNWGRQKVVYGLRLKHLPNDAINEGLATVSDEQYEALLLDLACKKAAGYDLRTEADRARLIRFLNSRGYTVSEINNIIPKIKQK